ncbi:MAG: M23 family metallopeptidase [bacterium]
MENAVYPARFDIPHSNGLGYLQYFPDQNVFHTGWDLNEGFGNADIDNPVVCHFEGRVEFITPAPSVFNRQNRGWGWMVVLYHEKWGVWSRYAHLNKKPTVSVGQKLQMGQQFAEVGRTGTKSAHLHWDMWDKKLQDYADGDYYFYPIGYNKAFVNEHFIDGLAFVEALNQPPRWEDLEYEWAANYIKNRQLLESGYVPSMVALVHRQHDELKTRIERLEAR